VTVPVNPQQSASSDPSTGFAGAQPLPQGPVESKPKSKIRLVVSIVVGLVVIGGAIYTWTTSAKGAQEGDCIVFTNADQNDATADQIDCNDPRGIRKVAKRLDSGDASCPQGDYDEYYQPGSGGFKLCLMLNAKEGDCLKNLEDDQKTERIACGGPDVEVKVAKMVSGTADENACDPETLPLVFSEPATTFCFGQP
jgi:hypothetical protein